MLATDMTSSGSPEEKLRWALCKNSFQRKKRKVNHKLKNWTFHHFLLKFISPYKFMHCIQVGFQDVRQGRVW